MDEFRTQLENLNLGGAIRITSPHTSGDLVVPQEVTLEKDDGEIWIKYRFPLRGKSKKPQGALQHFLALAEETTGSEKFLKFAQQWGVLCICEGHNLVASHNNNKLCFPRNDAMNFDSFLDSYFAANTKPSQTQIFFNRMSLTEQDTWFKEPLSVWREYASRMKALINIFLSLRGEFRGDISASWRTLRQIEDKRRTSSPIRQFEQQYGVSIQQLELGLQFIPLLDILRVWIEEADLYPNLVWNHNIDSLPSPDLAVQCSLRATYSDVGLFYSDHLTLFSVLVAQCITALGPNRYVRQCGCMGCKAHTGSCQELTLITMNRGRPSSYCEICRRYVHQQQKSASRKNRRMERSNQHE